MIIVQLSLFEDVDLEIEPIALGVPTGLHDYHPATGVGLYNRYSTCQDEPPAYLSNGEPDWCEATRADGSRCRSQRHFGHRHVFGFVCTEPPERLPDWCKTTWRTE